MCSPCVNWIKNKYSVPADFYRVNHKKKNQSSSQPSQSSSSSAQSQSQGLPLGQGSPADPRSYAEVLSSNSAHIAVTLEDGLQAVHHSRTDIHGPLQISATPSGKDRSDLPPFCWSPICHHDIFENK